MEVGDEDKHAACNPCICLHSLVQQQYSEIDMDPYATQNRVQDNSYRKSRAQNSLYNQGLDNPYYLHDDGRPRN